MRQDSSPQPRPFSLIKIQNLFLLNGITALLGWNAVLSSMDYYSYIYDPNNIVLWFPTPLFVAYLLSGILYNYMSKVKSYRFLLTIGIIITNISLFVLFLLSIIFKNSIQTGFVLSLVTCFIIGFASNTAQLTFFAMINYLGTVVVSRFTIGTAISGLMLVVLRMIIVAILGSDESNTLPIWIYMVLAILFNFFNLVLNIKFFASSDYKEQVQAKLPRSKNTEESRQLLDDASGQNQSKSYARLMLETMKAINPYPLYIGGCFVITFMLFPALTFEKKMDMNVTWAILVFNLMYNIGDTLGKTIGDFRKSFNSYSILYTLMARLFFFYTIPIMDSAVAEDDQLLNNNYFPFINQLIFGLSNGFVINGSFVLAFEKAPDQYKKYAGVLGGLSLQLGIMIGSFLAIPFETLVDPVK